MAENKREAKRKEKQLQEELQKYRQGKMIKVNDGENWHPCFPKHEVYIHIGITWNSRGNYGEAIMCVFGADDTGVEKRFLSNDLDILIREWNKFKKFYDEIPQTTNIRYYLDRDFIYA